MSHRDIEALKERIKVARAKPKRNYRKANLSQTKKAELCQALVEADVAVKESLLNREAIMWQNYKAGLPPKTPKPHSSVTKIGNAFRLRCPQG